MNSDPYNQTGINSGADMKWITDAPVEAGWYWWRPEDCIHGEVVHVRRFGGPLIVIRDSRLSEVRTFKGEWWPERVKSPEDQ